MSWLNVVKTAELLSVTASAVQKAVKQDKYEYRYVNGIGRGGKQIEILLDSLPEEAQTRYRGENPKYKSLDDTTFKQREEANQKAYIVHQYWQSWLSPKEFVSQYNEDRHENQITISQLYRWQQKLKKNNDVADLIDTRGGHNRGETAISDEAWNYFYSLYMVEQQPSIQRCYEFTARRFSIPSVSTFERKVKAIPLLALIRYREGETAFKNKCLPYMERDYTDINSNDIWFSDHHLADVFVLGKLGKPCRPWITIWTDARSRKIMSIRARNADPNTDVIKDTLREGMETYGIPYELYVDNGKDYKAKDAFGRDYPLSLVNRLGINTIYATKYHGQAKTVERFFGTLEDRFGRLFQTYAGSDAKKRPESLKEVPISEYPTLEEYTVALLNYIDEYNKTTHSGNGMDNCCPNQVYYEQLYSKRQISDPKLLRLLCGRVEERTVLRNGVNIFDNTYWHDSLPEHFGKKVTVIYDPANIEEMNIFDIEGNALCIATPRIKTPFRKTSADDFRDAKKKQRISRKIIKELEPTRNLHVWQQISQDQVLEKQYAEIASISTSDMITSMSEQGGKLLKMQVEEAKPIDDNIKKMQQDMMKYLAKGG